MYVQVITASVTDVDAHRRSVERWKKELRPGATGFLGDTRGIAEDGTMFVLARWESAEAAQQHDALPEQQEWLAEAQQHLDGLESHESTDVTLMGGGGSNDAGFVQVMFGHILDEAAYGSMMARMSELGPKLQAVRPDVLGGVTVRLDADRYVDVVYFSSEAEARDGEAKELPEDLQSEMAEMMTGFEVDRYLDLKDPQLD
jgi:hypothetical protein